MRSTLTVTAKGQVTLRKDLLRHLGVKPGDRIAVEFLPSGRLEVSAEKPEASIDRFIGCLESQLAKPLTIAEMNDIIADGWAGNR